MTGGCISYSPLQLFRQSQRQGFVGKAVILGNDDEPLDAPLSADRVHARLRAAQAQRQLPPDVDALITKAVTSAVQAATRAAEGRASDQIKGLRAEVAKLTQTTREQAERIEELSREPDPRLAPYRGKALGSPQVAARISLANEASLAQRRRELEAERQAMVTMEANGRTTPGLAEYARGRVEQIDAELGKLAAAHLAG